MARLNTTHSTGPDSVFAIAARFAATAAEHDAIRNEADLERLYHLRLARRNAHLGSSLDNLELAKLAGWS